jgi:hypothetical protein
MGAAAYMYTVLFPAALLAGAIVRDNLLAFFCMVCFVLNVIWTPHPLLPARRLFARILATFLFVFYMVVSVGHIVFQLLFYFNVIDTNDQISLLAFFGFPKVATTLDVFRYIVPDGVLFVITLILFILFQRQVLFSQTTLRRVVAKYEVPKPLFFNAAFAFCALFVAGVSYPSIPQLIYFIGFLSILFMKAFARKSFLSALNSFWIPLYVTNILHLLLVSLFQIPLVSSDSFQSFQQVVGVFNARDLQWSMRDMGLVVGWGGAVVLFVLLSYKFRELMLSKKLGPQVERNISNFSTHLREKLMEREGKVQTFLRNNAWKVAMLGLFCVVLFVQSVLSLVLLLAVFLGIILPQHTLEKYKIVHMIMGYFLLSIFLQYCYNLPFGFPQSPTLSNIGLRVYDVIAIWIGLQCVSAYLLAIACCHRRVVVKEESLQDIKKESEKEQLIIREGEENLSSEKRQTIILRHRLSRDLRFWETEHFATFKYVVRVIWHSILRHSYKLSLAGLYVICLTSVNLINAGYMFIFIIFVWSPKIAIRCWLILVLYCATMVALIYFWNFSWTSDLEGNYWTELIGLHHYSNYDLVFRGLLWHIIILLFSVIQWRLIVYISQIQVSEKRQRESVMFPRWLNLMSGFLSHCQENYGLLCCYITLISVALFTSLSFVNLLYLIFVFICLCYHMKTQSAYYHIKKFWFLVVIFAGLVLVARYVYQFAVVASWLQSIYPNNPYISLREIGLEVYENFLFLNLLGNSIVFLVTVIQFRTFFGKRGDHIDEYNAMLRSFTRLTDFRNFCKRFFILHSDKITAIVVFIVSLSPICAMHLVYVISLLLAILTRTFIDTFGFPLLLYSMLLITAQLCYQFPARVFIPDPNLTQWIGFRVDTNHFSLVQGYLWIILCLLLGRFARRWKHEFSCDFESIPTDDYVAIVEEPKKEEETPTAQQEQVVQWSFTEITLFLYDDEFKPATDGNFHRNEFVQGAKWYTSNLFKILHEPIFVLVLLIAAYVRFDLLGLIYLLMAGLICFVTYRLLENSRVVVTFLICAEFIVLAQYFVNLGFPQENFFPWRNLPFSWQIWLSLRTFDSYLLLVDFFVLLTLAQIIRLSRSSLSEFRSSSYWKNIIECNSKLEDFTAKPRLWRNSVRYYFYRYSIYWILIFLFIVGTVTKNVFSLIYLTFALFYLYRGQTIFQKRDTLWRWVRYYNFLIIIIEIVYQAPFIPSNSKPESAQQILGLSKLNERSFSLIVFHFVVFILLSFQSWLFHRPEFDLVVQKMSLDREIALERAKKRWIEHQKQKEQDFEKIRAENKRRKEQLQTLRICRQKQQELWRVVGHPSATAISPESSVITQRPQQPLPIQTTADIKRLQEVGALQIQSDETQHGLKLTFQAPKAPTSSQSTVAEPKPESKEEIFVSLDAGEKDESKATKGDKHSESESESSSGEENDKIKSDVQREEGTNIGSPSLSDRKEPQSKLMKFIIAVADVLIKVLSRLTSTKEKRLEDLDKSRRQKLVIGIMKLAQNNSKWICFIWFMLTAVVEANVLSLVLPISMFMYAILEKPRPHKNYWRLALIYLELLIIVKFIFQFSVFCICEAESGDVWSLQPQCENKAMCGFVNNGVALQIPEVIGIVPIKGPFIVGIFFELIAMITILFHRHNLKKKGLWNEIKVEGPSFGESVTEGTKEKDVIRVSKQVMRAEIKHQKRKEKWQNYEAKVLQKKIRKLQKKKETEGLNSSEESILTQALAQMERLQSQELSAVSMKPSENKEVALEDVLTGKKEGFEEETYLKLESPLPEDKERAEIEEELQEEKSFISKIRRFGNVIKNHFKGLVFRTKEIGRDLYVGIFVVELVCFFFVALFPGDFTGSNTSGLNEFLTEDRLPTSYVLVLLGQFILIVIDRILFLYRSILFKLILHYFLTIFYHVWLLFIIPLLNNRRFHDSPTLVVIYILKLVYLFISGIQIMYGYPFFLSRFLTDSEHPGVIRRTIFMIYRAIPFLWELNTILDWATTKTALGFYEWLKLEDLYDDLFLVLGRIESERNTERRTGDPQPWYMKVFVGGGLFVVLCLVIWFPLLILMQGAPGNQPNYVRETTVTFAIEGFDPIYRTVLSQANIQQNVSQEYFAELRNKFSFVLPDDRDNIQIMTFNSYSGRQWSITPPALAALRKLLEPNETTAIYLTWEFNFRRDNPPQLLVLTIKQQKQFTSDMKQNLLEVLNGVNTTFNVTAFFPRFYRLPVDGQVIIPPENEQVNCFFLLRESALEFNFTNNNETITSRHNVVFWEALENSGATSLFPSREINIVTISNVLPTGFVGTFLVTAGIIGLYVGVVLAVGRFLRISVTLLYTRIMFEDMPECDEIISYCKDIFLARQDGDLELEEELFRELIELYRSPERLILRTLPKKPRFKEPKPKEKTE